MREITGVTFDVARWSTPLCMERALGGQREDLALASERKKSLNVGGIRESC
jgi:hypothetical protein